MNRDESLTWVLVMFLGGVLMHHGFPAIGASLIAVGVVRLHGYGRD